MSVETVPIQKDIQSQRRAEADAWRQSLAAHPPLLRSRTARGRGPAGRTRRNDSPALVKGKPPAVPGLAARRGQ